MLLSLKSGLSLLSSAIFDIGRWRLCPKALPIKLVTLTDIITEVQDMAASYRAMPGSLYVSLQQYFGLRSPGNVLYPPTFLFSIS